MMVTSEIGPMRRWIAEVPAVVWGFIILQLLTVVVWGARVDSRVSTIIERLDAIDRQTDPLVNIVAEVQRRLTALETEGRIDDARFAEHVVLTDARFAELRAYVQRLDETGGRKVGQTETAIINMQRQIDWIIQALSPHYTPPSALPQGFKLQSDEKKPEK